MNWVDFEYRDFYDLPRAIAIKVGTYLVFLDSPFLEQKDEYSDEYFVYVLPSDTDLRGDWRTMALSQARLVGRVPVKSIRFSEDRRSRLDLDCIRELLPT
jgi:hypothetical protein